MGTRSTRCFEIEDLFATLAKGKLFTKLDLAQAYQQLKLNAKAKELVVINTHKGLFRYTRLPFGISSAPGNFSEGHGGSSSRYSWSASIYRRYFDIQRK